MTLRDSGSRRPGSISRRTLYLGAAAALLFAGVFFVDPGRVWAQDEDLRWAIGPWGGGYKFIGGEGDMVEAGPEGGLQVKYFFSERAAFGIRLGYGENQDTNVPDYRTTVLAGEAFAQINLITDRPYRPFVVLGLGVNSWRSELGLVDVVTPEGTEVEATEGAVKLGLGVELDLAAHLSFEVRGTGNILLREDDEMDLGGIGDPNDSEIEITAAILHTFSGERPPPVETTRRYLGYCGTRRPRDSDQDGVFDKDDRCPDTPVGVRVDARGCPVDSDGDGVDDGLDQCPNTPVGATVDRRGCPGDSDGDGVYDGLDRCPDTPARVVVDRSGCPLDTDGDGVPDGIDECPDTPWGADVDDRGCIIPLPAPMVLVGVTFQSGTANLLPSALGVLNEMADDLRTHPDVRVEIRGHTDSVGGDDLNRDLSQRRAESVRNYLISRGVAAHRLTAVGLGESEPIAPNDTPNGRAKNRRVEFRRID